MSNIINMAARVPRVRPVFLEYDVSDHAARQRIVGEVEVVTRFDMTPLGRFDESEEVAAFVRYLMSDFVRYLMSDEASYVAARNSPSTAR